MTAQPLFEDDNQPEPWWDTTKCGTTLTNYQYGCRCHKCHTLWRTYNNNLRRGIKTCKQCGKEYHRTDPQAGTKYCSDECKTLGYNPIRGQHGTRQEIKCPNCGKWEKHGSRRVYDLCRECLNLTGPAEQTFKNHHVPEPLVIQFINDPTCSICGTNIAGNRRTTQGKYRSSAVVDHDHNCCASNTSCGKCVRGIVCNHCNVSMGNAFDNPTTLRALADYLDKWNQP